jgi:hypothetical protein
MKDNADSLKKIKMIDKLLAISKIRNKKVEKTVNMM